MKNPKLSYTCEHCHKSFMAKLDHGKVPRFCSRDCFNDHRRIDEEKRTCPNCSKIFTSKKEGSQSKVCCCKQCSIEYFLQNPDNKENHPAYKKESNKKKICQNPNCGKEYDVKTYNEAREEQKYCSYKCFIEVKGREREECTCKNCGKKFTGLTEEKRVYCSRECYFEDTSGTYIEKECAQCNKNFYVLKSELEITPRAYTCCSKTCKDLYYHGDKANHWKGGRIETQTNGPTIYTVRDDKKSKYTGEHRLICENIIGRKLHRSEIVIRLDREPNNNIPENLFICGDTHIAGKYLMGAWEWPRKSNLDTYK